MGNININEATFEDKSQKTIQKRAFIPLSILTKGTVPIKETASVDSLTITEGAIPIQERASFVSKKITKGTVQIQESESVVSQTITKGNAPIKKRTTVVSRTITKGTAQNQESESVVSQTITKGTAPIKQRSSVVSRTITQQTAPIKQRTSAVSRTITKGTVQIQESESVVSQTITKGTAPIKQRTSVVSRTISQRTAPIKQQTSVVLRTITEESVPIQEQASVVSRTITDGVVPIQQGARVASWTISTGFVNKANCPVQKGSQMPKCVSQCPQKDIFYCGRNLGVGKIPDSDGQCGPCCGPNCDDCKNCTFKDEAKISRGNDLVASGNGSQLQDYYGKFEITDDQGSKALEDGKIGVEVKIPITFTTIRITCSSAECLEDSENYVGMIVYDIGTYDAQGRTGSKILPGWILIIKSEILKDVEVTGTDETMVHGPLVQYYFQENYKVLAEKYGVVYGGFAIMQGVFKFNSAGLNIKDKYHDGKRAMHPVEARLVEGAIRLAKKRPSFNGQTIQVGTILYFWLQREKELDDQASRTADEQEELNALQIERKARENNQDKLKQVTITY